MSMKAKQRMTLNNLSEPQQLRELNRQLEWVWNQLMGGLTSRSLSTGLRQEIQSGAARRFTGGAHVTVGEGGDYPTLAALAAAVNNRALAEDVTAEVLSDLEGGAALCGTRGAGRLIVEGGGHAVTGGMTLNGARADIRNLSFAATVTVQGGDVRFTGVSFNGGGGEAALVVKEGANCGVENCALTGASNLIRLENATLDAANLRGSGTRWLLAEHATIRASGTRPQGGAQMTACLCAPGDLSSLTANGAA